MQKRIPKPKRELNMFQVAKQLGCGLSVTYAPDGTPIETLVPTITVTPDNVKEILAKM